MLEVAARQTVSRLTGIERGRIVSHMHILSLYHRRAAACLILLGAAACSSEAGSGAPMQTGDQRVSMMVDAAAGATLLLDDGASVRLPPGALATDAEVSFSRETCDGVYASRRFQSCVYRVDAPDAGYLQHRRSASV